MRWIEDRVMKIMTFNTQHCLSFLEKKIDCELMARVISDFDADVVGLNEMYFGQTERLSELTGLEHSFFAPAIEVTGRGHYGNGFLSRYAILSAENIPIPDPETKAYKGYYETRCILKAELEGGVTALVTHFGLNPDERELAVKTVLKHLKDEKCILMGDFNSLPEDAILDPIRERMKDAADCFDIPKLSFPSDYPDRKIDYIFLSRDIEVISADIPAVIASDHRPHTATVAL